jgi:hypothetical protein
MSLEVPELKFSPNINPLPPVIVNESVSQPQIKPFIILHTKNIDNDDLDSFRSFGNEKVIIFDESVEGKIKLCDFKPFSYLFLDLRNKHHRHFFDINDTDNYNIVCYISQIESFDPLIDSLAADRVCTKFPKRTHLQDDFDKSLLTEKTDSPNIFCSILNFGLNFLEARRKK